MERYRTALSFHCPTSFLSASDRQHSSIPPKPGHRALPPPISSSMRRGDDAELGIFGAERYFRDCVTTAAGNYPLLSAGPGRNSSSVYAAAADDASTDPRYSSVSSIDGYGRVSRHGTFATPTASSEASWNSRSGLLTRGAGSAPAARRSSPGTPCHSGGRRRLFGLNCPCVGRMSVDVEEMNNAEPRSPASARLSKNPSAPVETKEVVSPSPKVAAKSSPDMVVGEIITKMKVTPGKGGRFLDGVVVPFSPKKPPFPPEIIGHRIINTTSAFSFPVSNTPAATNPKHADEPPRCSLEVFRPADELDQQLFKKPPQPPLSFGYNPTPAAALAEEEARSDASSDLFEIESFAASTYRRRDSLDELAAPPTPSECGGGRCNYPPSEASVVWSVATAEGFDRASAANFSSAASEYYDEYQFLQAEHDRFAASIAAPGHKKTSATATSADAAATAGGGAGGLLMNCRCEKAVSVGPSPVRMESELRMVAGRTDEPRLEASFARLASGGAVRCQPGRAPPDVKASRFVIRDSA